MTRLILNVPVLVIAITLLVPAYSVSGQRRRVVVRPARVVVRHPVRTAPVVIRRAPLMVRRGYPIRRALPASVVFRPARWPIVVAAPLSRPKTSLLVKELKDK